MIELASGDVSKLIDVYSIQSKADRHKSIADQRAAELMKFFSECKLGIVKVHEKGRFIGRGGENLRSIQRRTNTYFYQRGNRSGNDFFVYYTDAGSLEKVRMEGEIRTRSFGYY